MYKQLVDFGAECSAQYYWSASMFLFSLGGAKIFGLRWREGGGENKKNNDESVQISDF